MADLQQERAELASLLCHTAAEGGVFSIPPGLWTELADAALAAGWRRATETPPFGEDGRG